MATRPDGAPLDGPETLRLDVWLWRARFYKTRALSAEAIAKRGVRIDRTGQVRKTSKPGASVAPGDILTLRLGPHIRTIEIIGLGTRRGPPAEAQALYADQTPRPEEDR